MSTTVSDLKERLHDARVVINRYRSQKTGLDMANVEKFKVINTQGNQLRAVHEVNNRLGLQIAAAQAGAQQDA